MKTRLSREMRRKKAEFFAVKYWLVIVLTVVAIGLLVGSFVWPPPGVIDLSVISAVGEIFAFAALVVFVIRAESGADVTFQKGDVVVSVHNDEQQEAIKETEL